MGATVPASLINKLSKPIKELLNKPKKLKTVEKATVTKAARRLGINMSVADLKKAYKALGRTDAEKAAGAGKYKPKKPNPKLKNDPGNVAPKNKQEVKRLQKQQELDDANMLSERRKEMMTKDQYLESNPLERKSGPPGSGADVSQRIMRAKDVTKGQTDEVEKMAAEGKGFQIKKYGGKVKRNMGGPAKPRKKTVFRRGGGQALRGFGKATYSNKMY